MNVLCISKLTYDIFCPIDGDLVPGMKYDCPEKQECGGGEAVNAAFLLGKWGQKSIVTGVVGSDDFAAKIKKELQSVQIDTNAIETSYEKPTILSFYHINKSNGMRTVIRTFKNDCAYLRKHDFGLTPDLIISDGHEYAATHEALERNPNAISILCADSPKPEIMELSKFSKYILCSLEFAETLLKYKVDFNDLKTVSELYQNLNNRFPNANVIVTLGNKGTLYSNNGEIKIMPGIHVKTVDMCGAGDAFRGAFAYGLANNFDIEKCVTYANIAAGLTLNKFGTRQAFPSLSEVITYYNQKFPPAQSVNQPVQNGTMTQTSHQQAQVNTATTQNVAPQPVATPQMQTTANVQTQQPATQQNVGQPQTSQVSQNPMTAPTQFVNTPVSNQPSAPSSNGIQ